MPKKKSISRYLKPLKKRVITPKTNQDIIKMLFQDFHDNIMRIDNNIYSICLEYSDISFAKADLEEAGTIFLKWVDYLNSFNKNTHIQINKVCVPIDTEEYKKQFTYDDEKRTDKELELVHEFNHLIDEVIGVKKHTLLTKRYLTISQKAMDFDDAKSIFLDMFQKTERAFKDFKSSVRIVSNSERLTLIHDFFNIEMANDLGIIDFESYAKANDLTIYDVLATKENISLKATDYLEITSKELLNIDESTYKGNGNTPRKKFIRILYVDPKFPKSISPKFYNTLTNLEDIHMFTTVNIQPVETIKAIKNLTKKQSGLETERYSKIKNLAKQQLDYAFIKDERLEKNISSVKELIYDVSNNDQKIFKQNILVGIITDSYAELENQTARIQNKVGEMLINLMPLKWQQLEGIKNLLPLGHNTLQFQKLETSEGTGVHVPFNSKDFLHPHSIFYGKNIVSNNAIFLDRSKLSNGNGCILATSGAGKSFQVKTDIEQNLLRNPNTEVIIIDYKKEYEKVVNWFDGQTISISDTSNTYINPLDIDIHYTLSENKDDNPIKAKVEYMQSWIESILDQGTLKPITKTVVDRCVKNLYIAYEESFFKDHSKQPLLEDLYHELLKQEEKEAHDLAKALERFVYGTMDIFAHKTNIDIKNRIVSFDLSNLQKSIQTAGYLVVLDHIMHRLGRNSELGIRTLIYIDEFHILLSNYSAAEFVSKIVKIGRQFGAFPNVITQNISEMSENEFGRKILGNVEFAIILKQKEVDRETICNIFNISNEEARYISGDAKQGQGIIVYGNDKIPFFNPINKKTRIFELNNTDHASITRD